MTIKFATVSWFLFVCWTLASDLPIAMNDQISLVGIIEWLTIWTKILIDCTNVFIVSTMNNDELFGDEQTKINRETLKTQCEFYQLICILSLLWKLFYLEKYKRSRESIYCDEWCGFFLLTWHSSILKWRINLAEIGELVHRHQKPFQTMSETDDDLFLSSFNDQIHDSKRWQWQRLSTHYLHSRTLHVIVIYK